ncbi:MAG: septum site-determining protein MinC [Arsenophonus sp.]|nr:MAG: septum site-determining protein MinC [Arsenophonus sp.]
MLESLIELEGSNFTLTVLRIYTKDLNLIKKAIQKKIKEAPGFLKNAPVIFNASGFTKINFILNIYNLIKKTGLKIVAITGCNNLQLKNQIINAGLPVLKEGHKKKNESENLFQEKNINDIYEKTKIIDQHVRSGQRIYAKNSDLIVNSHVSTGAELIADGNIHIYGTMRGRVLAGASGAQDCQIYCTHFKAELVSIAGKFWLSENIPISFFGKTARFYLSNKKLKVKNII